MNDTTHASRIVADAAVGLAAQDRADDAASARIDPYEACLLFLLEHHGRALSLAALRAGIVRPEGAWQLDDFVDAAESLGFTTETLRAPEPPAPHANEPMLLPAPGGGACLLIALHRDGSGDVMLPGAAGADLHSREQLRARYDGRSVRLRPPLRAPADAPETARGRHGHWFWGPILIARPLYRRAGLAAVLTNLFALASSIFAMIVYDRVIPNSALATLYALLTGVAIVFVSDFVIRMLRGYFIDVAGARADAEIADALFDHLLDLDLRARRGPAGGLASVLNQYETLREFFTSATLTTLVDLPFALLFIAVMYVIGGPMAWVPVLAIVLIFAVAFGLQPRMRRHSQVSQEDSQLKQSVLVETLSGLETIKALGAGGAMRRRWQGAVAHSARLSMKMRLLAALAANWGNLVFMSSQVAVVTIGVFLAVKGEIGTGAIVAGSILCGRAVQPMSQIAQLLIRLNQTLASYRALARVMSMPREHAPGVERMPLDRLEGSIELHEVSFRYPGVPVAVLDKVSLRIAAGERVAVIGRVGSGKTTLVKMLLGLNAPDEGALRVGGYDMRQIDPADLRRNIGSVMQEVWLMTGTLRQNIALGAERPGDAQVIRAAQAAGVHEFAAAHPNGYQLRIGEQGEGLSGGQRQAVAMARALIGDPPILLFDEPTSAMDPTSERQLLDRLKTATLGKTLVLVTHKPSMLELVDKLVVMDRGRIIAQGPKDAVLRAMAGGAPSAQATQATQAAPGARPAQAPQGVAITPPAPGDPT